MRLKLCHPLESRDGTLNADSKMKNLVVENVEGDLVAVKRPGATNRTELPAGLAQGLFSLNGMAYAIVNDTLYGGFTPGGGGGSGSAGWVQIPNVMPFVTYPEYYADSNNGKIVVIGIEKLPMTEYRYVFSSTDAAAWLRSAFVVGAYPPDWPWYGQDASKWIPREADIFCAGGYFWTSYYYLEKHYFSRSQDLISWEHIYKRDRFNNIDNTWLPADLCVTHNGALLRFHVMYGSSALIYSTTDGMTWTDPVPTNLTAQSWVRKIISHSGYLFAFRRYVNGANEYTQILKSADGGLTWSGFAWLVNAFVDCISTTDGILAVTENNQTWMVTGENSVTRKDYTLPSASMKNGHLVALGTDLFMLGCGDQYNTAFKLVDSSGPVGSPL